MKYLKSVLWPHDAILVTSSSRYHRIDVFLSVHDDIDQIRFVWICKHAL